MQPDELKRMLEAGLPGATVEVQGDGRHFEALIVSEAFAGKTMIQQHRMVYAALGDSFARETVHALSLKTFSADEWARRAGS